MFNSLLLGLDESTANTFLWGLMIGAAIVGIVVGTQSSKKKEIQAAEERWWNDYHRDYYSVLNEIIAYYEDGEKPTSHVDIGIQRMGERRAYEMTTILLLPDDQKKKYKAVVRLTDSIQHAAQLSLEFGDADESEQ